MRRYIIHALSILCWHVFCLPKKTCFIHIKNTSLIQKHRSITLTWGCLCGKGMPFWRIKGVPFMCCISTHKWIWSRLCGRRVMRRHNAPPLRVYQMTFTWPLHVWLFHLYLYSTIIQWSSNTVKPPVLRGPGANALECSVRGPWFQSRNVEDILY